MWTYRTYLTCIRSLPTIAAVSVYMSHSHLPTHLPQMKELDAALSRVLQSSSELETDASPLTNTLTDTLKARQQLQVANSCSLGHSSLACQLLLHNKPHPLQPSQSLPCPVHHNMEVVVDVRKVVELRPSGSPPVCCGHILRF